MISWRLASTRLQFRARYQNALSEVCSRSKHAPTTTISRAVIENQLRLYRSGVIFLMRIRNRFFTECMLISGGSARRWSVKATPAHQLCPPCDVRILAIDEEVGVEELATYRDVLNHLPPVKRRSRRGPENILEAEVVPVINLLTAAIQVPQHRGKVDTSRINQLFFRKIEAGADSEELAADGPDLGIDLSCIHQRLNEIRQQQHVRVERQNPLPMR